MKHVTKHRTLITELLVVCLMSLVALSYFFNRGFNYYDEGHVLHLAERILQGDVPYRDFHFIYTPGTLYITAMSFMILGVSIISGRVLLLIIAIITSALIYILTKRVTDSRIAAIIACAVYLAWCPSHINYPWPVHFAILCGCVITLTLNVHTTRRNTMSLLLAGVLVFFTFFFKHNFGVAAAIIVVAYILPRPNKIAYLLRISAGFLSVSLVYALYLVSSGSIAGFYHDMLFYTYQKILVEHMLWTPFVYGSGVSAVTKTVFFLSPLLIVSAAWSVLYQQKKVSARDLYIFSFPAAFYVLGIRPTTDFIHLAPLLSLSGIPLSYLIAKAGRNTMTIAGAISLLLILAGFHSALFRGYYRWETPLVKQNIYINKPRIGIYVDKKYQAILTDMSHYFERQPSRDVLIYEYAPTFYTALNLHNPTAYDLLPSSALSPDIENEVVADVMKRHIPTVITDAPLETRTHTKISQYIRQNYEIVYSRFEFSIWKRKDSKAD